MGLLVFFGVIAGVVTAGVIVYRRLKPKYTATYLRRSPPPLHISDPIPPGMVRIRGSDGIPKYIDVSGN